MEPAAVLPDAQGDGAEPSKAEAVGEAETAFARHVAAPHGVISSGSGGARATPRVLLRGLMGSRGAKNSLTRARLLAIGNTGGITTFLAALPPPLRGLSRCKSLEQNCS
mmetsp:Transcript_15792/g.49948  ORF Transcript_15792/g.49948 Transcript_15792/m.49948 type:complete len:109 (+) Transcript_15792:824-1150(+)